MAVELLKIFNDNMQCLGICSREEAHAKGYWHETFHCWIIKKVNKKEYILFQKRSESKDVYPNALDITIAGHIKSTDNVEDGIIEMNEELGIEISFEQLTSLGIRVEVLQTGDVISREFCHTFIYECNSDLLDYNIQEDELAGLVEIEISDGIKMFAGEVEKVKAMGYKLINGKKEKDEIEVCIKDIIPRVDRYYLKVFIMAQRYFEGHRKYLAI
jgi:isopentenyldiphosphate isomerase